MVARMTQDFIANLKSRTVTTLVLTFTFTGLPEQQARKWSERYFEHLFDFGGNLRRLFMYITGVEVAKEHHFSFSMNEAIVRVQTAVMKLYW